MERLIVVAVIVNLVTYTVAAWVLIFGKCGLPPMGMTGAALAVLAGDATALLVQFAAYLRPKLRQEFNLDQAWRFDRPLMGRLLRYGFPSGLEFVVTFTAFAVMVSLFNGYGEAVAAAVTLAFNWDMVAFVPMIGLQIAGDSFLGQWASAIQLSTGAWIFMFSIVIWGVIFYGIINMKVGPPTVEKDGEGSSKGDKK